MKSKKLVSIVLTAALITSMQTNVFAAEVSNTDTASVCESITVQETEQGIVAYSQDEESSVSGKCGDNLTWTFNKSTEVLTISGNGDMWNYSIESNGSPWSEVVTDDKVVKAVKFEGNITSIGNYAFYKCYQLKSINLPDTITSIGEFAFKLCGITDIKIPKSVSTIKLGTFIGSGLESISIPSSVKTIEDYAYYECMFLEDVKIPDSVSCIGEGTFGYCTLLECITIPKTITTYK